MKRAAANLFLNHVDAWGTALIVAILAVINHNAWSRPAWILIGALAVGYWLAFALNDYFDAPYDVQDAAKARRNFFITYRKRAPTRLFFLLVSVALLPAFLSFGGRGLVIFAVACFVMWAYSAPPLRCKRRPGWDLLVHALFVETFPYAVCLWLLRLSWMPLDGALLVILFLASLTAQLEQQARDIELDARRERTFATTIGLTATHRLLQGLTAVLILFALIVVLIGAVPLSLAVFGLIGLPALLHRFVRRPEQPRAEWLVRLSIVAALCYTGGLLAYRLLPGLSA